MKEFFHTVKFKILVCIFALLLGFMIYVAASAGFSTISKNILETIASPFVTASTAISNWVEGTIDKFSNADRYKQENEALKNQLAEMYQDVLEKEKLEIENAQLKEMLEIDNLHIDFVWSAPCTVTARNASDISGGFTINRGSSDGIALYDPVFTKLGLIGMISEISPNQSKVTTLLSLENNIGVVTADSKVVGVIENDIKYSAEGLCLMKYVGEGSGIKVGEVVTTSGGVIFPDGILVGIVTEVVDDPNGLSVSVIIEPFEDVFSVNGVFVITDFEGQGENAN